MYRTGIVKLTTNARFSTLCLHAGQEPDPSTGAIITPIYQTSTYVQEELGKHKGYEYGRTQNPTRMAVERNIAAIEGGKAGFAFASGMAAIGAITTMLKAGDHVVVTDNTYGGTFRLFDKVLTKFQLAFSYVDTSRPEEIESAMRPETKMVFVETPTNPVLRLTDLARAAAIAHAGNARLVVDNTFASPSVQRPIEFGADLVIHSTNGQLLAEALEKHPKVKQVIYPGLPSHPQHQLAKTQMKGFGGMVSFDVGTFEEARRVCNSVRLMALAESLGGVETLISHPASMTHASVPPERRKEIGLTDSLVRISAGIEDVQDLIEDLAQALAE